MKLNWLIALSVLMFCHVSMTGQKPGKNITITGKVTIGPDKPVEGAVIFIDNIKTDILTDQKGNYRIKVRPDAREILAFSLLYGAAEEVINGRTEIDIKLPGVPGQNESVKKDESLKEQKTKNPVKESSKLNYGDDREPVYQDIYDMIRGRVAGVEVSDKSIKIRGTNSLNVSTEPLFVVDGVIVSSIDDVAPENVKTIEVLKGPDATVYGTRGSNGVIIITRRTGKE